MHMSIVGPESVAPGRFLRLPTTLVLALLGVLLGLTGCDDGNSTGPDPEPPSADGLVDVRITEVSEGNQWVELYNAGTEPVDVSSAWLCIPNGYQRVGDQSIVGPGDYVLDPGEWVAVEYSEIAADAGSVALYLNREDFTNAENIVDYVRWGDTNEGREAVAVDAGIWTAGDFIQPALPGNTISFLGGDPSANDSPPDWSEGIPTAGTGNDSAARLADLRITEVSEANQWVEVYNTGDTPVDIREAWLCVPSSNTGGDNIYVTIDGQPIVGPGDYVLDPGEWVAVEWDQIVPTDGSVGLYARAANGGRPDFADAGRIVDYVRWGDTNEGREAVAVAAGIWTAGAFIEPAPGGSTLSFTGADPVQNDDVAEWRPGTPTPGTGNEEAASLTDVRITEVSEDNQWVELYNTGTTPIDVSSAWLCVPNGYQRVGDQSIVGPGDYVLDPGEWVAVEYDQIAPEDGSVALYRNNSDFTSADNIVDYVRWGDTNEGREAVAVAAGIWTAGAFIEPAPSGNTIALFGDDLTENDDVSEWRAGDPTPGAGNDEAEVVTVTIDNIGASAWEVTDVEGESGVAPIGAQNPSLTLTVGRRYRIVNNGGGAHPFGIQNAADEYLLNQDGSGSLEADANIRYQEDANGVTFTYTQALADVGATYRCTVHAAMTGAVETR